MSATIHDFTKAKAQKTAQARAKKLAPITRVAKAAPAFIGRALVLALRVTAFTVMTFIRWPVMKLLHLVCGICFIAAPVAYFMVDDHAKRPIIIAALLLACVCAAVLRWVYDGITLALRPAPRPIPTPEASEAV